MTNLSLTFVAFVMILHSVKGFSPNIIGRGFYLPGIPFAAKTLNDGTGYKIFKDSSVQGCIQGPFPVVESRAQLSYYCNSEGFYTSISNKANLGGEYSNYFTLGPSLNFVQQKSVWKTEQVSGASIDLSITTAQYTGDLACIQQNVEYNDDFLQALRSLPIEVTNPELIASWDKYDSFLKVYGSHIMTGLSLGARIQYYATSSSSSSISLETFGARACADVATPVPEVGGIATVSGCDSYNSTQKISAQSVTIDTVALYLGGDGTYTASTAPPTTAEAESFLSTASTNPSPIIYEFALAIWDQLIADSHYLTSDDVLRAKNLKSYYLGFKAFDCQYTVIDGIDLQAFVYSSGAYQCRIAGEGCHSAKDCHLGNVYSACFCYGKTCVVHSEDNKVIIRDSKSGSRDEVPNESCNWDGFECKCTESNYTIAWPQQKSFKKSFNTTATKQASLCSDDELDSSSSGYNMHVRGINALLSTLLVLLTCVYVI